MKFQLFLSLIFIFLVHNLVFADDFDSFFEDIEVTEEEPAGSPINISGDIELKHSIPFNDLDSYNEPSLNNGLRIGYSTEDIELFSDFDIEISSSSTRIIPKESYLKTNFGASTFKTGYIEYNWGTGDKLNPTNNLNPKDYSNPLEVSKIPSISFSYEQFLNNNSLEVVYIPVKNGAVFPKKPLESLPGWALESDNKDKAILGGKLNHYGGFDLSLSYIWGLDDFYSVKELSKMSVENQRIHSIGISYKTIIGKFGLWLEGNYQFKDVNSRAEWVLGFDFSFGSEDQGMINLQTLGSYIPEYKTNSQEEILNNKLQNNVTDLILGGTGKISYELFNGEIKPETTVIFINYVDHDYEVIFKPEIIYSPLDSLDFKIGGSIALYDLKDLSTLYFGIEFNW